MSVTIYTVADLINIQRNAHATGLLNVTDGGTGINVNFSGLNTNTSPPVYHSECNVQAYYVMKGDLNHSSPINPVPSNARISLIEMSMQVNYSLTASAHIVSGPSVTSACSYIYTLFTGDTIGTDPWDPWITSGGFQLFSSSPPFVVGDSSNSLGPAGGAFTTVLDFTTNPNGDFPLGYMSYASFIANMASFAYSFSIFVQAGCSTTTGVEVATTSAAVSVQTTNIEITVHWDAPLSWTLEPPGLVLPDNVITITRPEIDPSSGGIGIDTQQIQKLRINGNEIDPNDPWIIFWLRFRIRLHLKPQWLIGQPPTIIIEVQLAGTEFTGFVPIGSVNITYADLSGIYTFDITKQSDTLYDRSSGIATQEVLIPAPFFVTSFINDNEVDILHFGGVRIRVTGQGQLKQILQSYDYINTQEIPEITLRTSNNVNPFVLANFNDQQASLRVYMDSIRNNMNVSRIVIFSIPLYTGYPQ